MLLEIFEKLKAKSDGVKKIDNIVSIQRKRFSNFFKPFF